jgi:hypothetical protein
VLPWIRICLARLSTPDPRLPANPKILKRFNSLFQATPEPQDKSNFSLSQQRGASLSEPTAENRFHQLEKAKSCLLSPLRQELGMRNGLQEEKVTDEMNYAAGRRSDAGWDMAMVQNTESPHAE